MFISRFSVRPERSRWSLWRGMWVVAWLMKWRRIWGWRTEVESSGTRWSLGWMRKQRRADGLWLRGSEPRHVVRLLRRAEEKLWEWVRNSVHQTCWIMHNKTMLMMIKALFRSVISFPPKPVLKTSLVMSNHCLMPTQRYNRGLHDKSKWLFSFVFQNICIGFNVFYGNDVNNMTGFAVLSYNMTMCSCGTGLRPMKRICKNQILFCRSHSDSNQTCKIRLTVWTRL